MEIFLSMQMLNIELDKFKISKIITILSITFLLIIYKGLKLFFNNYSAIK